MKKNYALRAKQYALKVTSGKISACAWVRKACQRHLDDLARAASGKWEYKFSARKANWICAFVEQMPHIKGVWASRGEKLELQPWQCFIYSVVFGWVHRETGMRRFRTIYIEMPRKNGKSTLSAPIGIYLLCADNESGAEVYSAATTRDQAKIIWEMAKKMVEKEPDLRKAFGIETSAHSIFQLSTASKFVALSAERASSLEGLNGSSLIDELHAHRTRKVWDVLETAKAARSQPMIWSITTAGADRSGICYEIRTYVTKILERVLVDETVFGIIYSADTDDDWKAEATWKKANPNYGISVDPGELRRLCLKAQKIPAAQNNYLTKHLSVWVSADVGLFDLESWLHKGFDPKLFFRDGFEVIEPPARFEGKRCWAGIDLAWKNDFSSLILLFKEEGEYYVFTRHYLPEALVEAAENASYAGWAREGWIQTTEGTVTDFRLIEEDLLEIARRYELIEVPHDEHQAVEFGTRMLAEGLPMVAISNNSPSLSEPTDKLGALISEGKIHHNGDPVLTWMLSNVVGFRNRRDLVYPTKDLPENKIDGAMALIFAVKRAMLEDPQEEKPLYDERPSFLTL